MLRPYSSCLPLRVKRAPSGDCWLHEIKHDGFRLIARRTDKTVKLYSKGGSNWPSRYPLIADAIGALRVSSIMLDGEVVLLDRNGSHDFDALRSRARDHEARLLAFDLLELNGEDYRDRPLLERKRRLARLLKAPRDGLGYVEHLTGECAMIFEHVCRLGLEGIVSKRTEHPYRET
jgi:bifunctional non-homologous end joining protein LigD